MPNPSDEMADLPDDFFNDLADERFIDEVIEKGGHESDEDLLHYVSEINRIQNDINIRKQKIKETEANLKSRRDRSSRSRSSSRSKSRRHHREKESKKRKRSRSRSNSPHTSRHSRHDERIRGARYPLSPVRGRALRRSRSKSPPHNRKRSSSIHRNMSFLEELAQKFAEKGQAFPEKDALLMGAQGHMNNNAAMQMNAPIPMDFGNPLQFDQPMQLQQPLIALPNFPQQQIGFPPQQQQNMFYGVNPMSILAGNPVPQPQPNLAPFPAIGVQPELQPIVANPHILPQPTHPSHSNNQKALIERCDQAIKLIRAKDNKVPVMKFLYNRTSLVVSNPNDSVNNSINRSPLQAHSTLNPLFKLNAPPNLTIKNNGLKMLPKRVRDVAQSLGINSELLFEKMRTKELNAQITDQITYGMDSDSSRGEILIQTNTIPLPTIKMVEMGIQTDDFKCQQCTERSKRIMVNGQSQTFFKGVSIGIQTNEKDYREPIVELLSRMTAAQLVAIKDFANIVDEPRPRNTDEMYKVRERLMDIYSLSQRDADAVRAAEDSHMDDTPLMDQHRFRSRDSMYGDGPSRDFDRRSDSPRFNGSNMGDRSSFGRSFEPNDFGNDHNNMMDDRARYTMEDRFRGMDGPPRQLTPQEEEEEIERQRYIQMERQRELELEMNQRRYDEQRELERNARLALQANHQQRPNPMSIDDDLRFREQDDIEMQRPNIFNMGRGGGVGGGGIAVNRRGRGAFRDSFRGTSNRGGRR